MKWNIKEAKKVMLGTDPKMAVLRLIAWREAMDKNPTQLAGDHGLVRANAYTKPNFRKLVGQDSLPIGHRQGYIVQGEVRKLFRQANHMPNW